MYWDYRRLGRLRVGASAYYGRDTNATSGVVTRPDGTYNAVQRISTQYDSLALAADARWTYLGWHLQTEWTLHQRAYTKEGRTLNALFLSSAALPADLLSWGGYGLLGYRFEWGGIMPFARIERDKTEMLGIPINLWSYQFGLNVRPVDVFVFKLAYEQVEIRGTAYGDQPSRSLVAQVAWAF